MFWFGDVLVCPREIGDGYIQDFEWNMNLSLFGSRRSLARSCLLASDTLISPPCTTYNIQFKESQQMKVLTRLTFTSPLQAFLSQSRYNYLNRGLTSMKSTSSTISRRSLIDVHTSNQACKLSISTSNQACKLNFTSNQACKIFKFSISNLALQIKIHFKSSFAKFPSMNLRRRRRRRSTGSTWRRRLEAWKIWCSPCLVCCGGRRQKSPKRHRGSCNSDAHEHELSTSHSHVPWNTTPKGIAEAKYPASRTEKLTCQPRFFFWN